ncbi:MAG: hypothetical protein QM662_08610 [Gordonia sp. (in: high G+C Gram-positive bacteria)]
MYGDVFADVPIGQLHTHIARIRGDERARQRITAYLDARYVGHPVRVAVDEVGVCARTLIRAFQRCGHTPPTELWRLL